MYKISPDIPPPSRSKYTVGWVCALPKEQTAATAMLDQKHTDLPNPQNDSNTYTLGSIGQHNIVIVCLSIGRIITHSAVTAATQMVRTFPWIRIVLMVSIGSGIPPKVRLGDVVVSTPVDQFPGVVVQWDFSKMKEGREFVRTRALNKPSTLLLTALAKLETEHDLVGSKIPEYLDKLKQNWPKLSSKYLKSDSLTDMLFNADYLHVMESIEVSSGIVGSAVQASLQIRQISLTGPFHSPISYASTTQNQPNTLSIAYNA
jgi:hypothetical protein